MTHSRIDYSNNRRRHDRLRADMQVSVRVASGVGRIFRRPFLCRALDYNRFGMAFVSPIRLRPGTVLNLDLSSAHMLLKGVEAEVVRGSRLRRSWRVGVHFHGQLSALNERCSGSPLTFLTGLEHSLMPDS